MIKKLFITALSSLSLIVMTPAMALASHSWGGYHWARTSNPFTVPLGDNLSSSWDTYLSSASSDWSASDVMDILVVPGKASKTTCKAVNGRVEVCNYRYGRTGWLGVAQIYISGLHITKGSVKLNDTYFNTTAYNTPAWKNLVTCQEVGHTFRLDHQDEDFNNAPLGTCMDYTNDPTPNQHPNQHDYDELSEIYAHLDSTTTLAQVQQAGSAQVPGDAGRNFGKLVAKHGKLSTYERHVNKNLTILTHVYGI